MKSISIALLLVLPILTHCQTVETDNSSTKKILVWSDEFETNGLPDAKKWSYEEGLIRNNEAQYYTKERSKNARVENGTLIITADKEQYQGAHYTSASINTRNKYAFTYGRVEVRAKLPQGKGTWPAIWTLGSNIDKVGWPTCGEIDIMEFVGYEPNIVYANVHTRDYNHTKNTGRGGKIDVEKPFGDFHIYAVEWYKDRMDFYFDDQLYFSCKKKGEGAGEWPFDAPQYLILNLAIGGAWGGQKGIDDSIFPVEYKIDYVRLYRLE